MNLRELGLLPLHGLARTSFIPAPKDGELILGRDPGWRGVKIADPRCSHRHASLMWRGGALYLRPVGSNGVWVNDLKAGTVRLVLGDHVRIGCTEFAYAIQGEPYRCASCLQTFVAAPPETPFCPECFRAYPLLGGTLAGRRLIRGLGSGSFGSVYVGHRSGNSYVALKVLRKDLPEASEVTGFVRESYTTVGLQHPNIVRYGDSGHEAGHWFIVLEYFHSRSLHQILERRGFLPFAEACPLVQQFLSALEYAHENKVLHRDVKPGNILVGDEGLVKLVDFGLAKRLVDTAFAQQAATVAVGAPLFMAPELLAHPPCAATFGTDIYSAGATVYRAITGRHPFEASTLADLYTAVQHEQVPPANSIRPEIPPRVSTALETALMRDPKRRQESVAELRRRLEL